MTFALTVLADLTVAVEIGMLFAALLYIYRVSQTTTVAPVTEEYIEDGRPHVLQDKLLPPYVLVLRIHGPFLFGATEKLAEATFDLDSLPPVVILRLRNMTAIDATGLHELERLTERLRDTGRTLLLCGARSQPEQLLRQSPFLRYLGEENLLPHVEAALSRAREVYEGPAIRSSQRLSFRSLAREIGCFTDERLGAMSEDEAWYQSSHNRKASFGAGPSRLALRRSASK